MRGRVLTLQQAAALLGWNDRWAPQRLRRLIEAREEEIGRHLMLRVGGQGRGRRYRITIAALSRAVDQPVVTADKVREELARHARRLQEVMDRLGERVDELEEAQGVMAEAIVAVQRARKVGTR